MTKPDLDAMLGRLMESEQNQQVDDLFSITKCGFLGTFRRIYAILCDIDDSLRAIAICAVLREKSYEDGR